MTKQRELSNLFESLRDSLGHYVRRMVPSKDVEDVVQETFLKFCKADARPGDSIASVVYV